MTVTFLGFVAASWGVIMALSPALQARRMLLTGSSRDVSIGYFMLLLPGFVLWVGYGLATDDLFLAVPNTLAALVACIVVLTAWRLRRPGRPPSVGGRG